MDSARRRRFSTASAESAHLWTAGLTRVRDAISLLEDKTTTEEVEDYKRFVLTLAHRVASAHREEGEAESEAELKAIETIESALSATG